MSEFLTNLDVTLIDDSANEGRGAWRVDEPFSYQSDIAHRLITIPAGFVTDFASVPRLPIIFWLTGDTSREAAVVHDYLYRTGILPRDTSDKVFFEASAVSGVPGWRRRLMYWGVRLGGALSYKGKKNV